MKRNVMRTMSLAFAGIMAAGALTACGGNNTAATTAAPAEQTSAAGESAAEEATAASGEKKVLKVAMECAYAPYNWTQPDDSNGAVPINDSNEYAYGYDVMMAKKICDELGYDLQIVRLDWDSLIPAVSTGQVDCVIAGQSITTERLQAVDFTEPYYYATIVTLVKNGSKYADAKSVADLAGKNVSVGAAGSGVYFNAVDILSAYGLGDLDADGKFTKINATYQSFGDSADSLKDGKIDAAFIVAGAPTTAITELATSGMDFSLVSLDQEHVDALHEKYPFLVQENLPACTYEGVDTETICVAVEAALVASTDMSEDAVYELTKTMFENLEELGTSHAKFQLVSAEKAAENGSVPMHPGAEKYYKEIGLL